MSGAPTRSAVPATSELVEGVLFYPLALVISATVCPGLTLCIPGLILLAVFVIVPIVALALVVALVAALMAAPVVLVRVIRGLGKRRAPSKSQLHAVVPSTAMGRPLIALSADRSRSSLAASRTLR